MSRPILVAALALSMSACVRPTEPTNAEAAKGGGPSGPNFAGNWSGTYVIGDCRQSQEIARANVCGALGSSSTYRLALTQSSQGVTASLTLQDLQFPPVTHKLNSEGALQTAVVTTSGPYRIEADLNLAMSGPDLGGSVQQFWTSSTLAGKATVSGRLSTATRTAP